MAGRVYLPAGTGRSRFPWIDKVGSSDLKVVRIPRNDCEAVYERGGRDEGIAIRPGIRHVEGSASLSDGRVNWQNAIYERGQDVPIHPGAEDLALPSVSSCDEQDAYFQLQYRDYGQVEARGGKGLRPPSYTAMCIPPLP